MRTVVAVFDSKDRAERAVNTLRERGFRDNEINIVAKEDRVRGNGGGRGRGNGEEGGMFSGEVGDGIATGGAIGGLAGLLAGAGALAIPGIGPIVAAGPIAGALSGAFTGGVAGGLIDFGIPEERGREYERKVREGSILALIKADEKKVDEATRIFREAGAREVETHDARRR
ncbi:MAG: hypothetical protein AB1497_07000 [Bacillota bacterium]